MKIALKTILIGFIFVPIAIFCFTIFLQTATAISAYFLVDLSSLTAKDVITTAMQKYFVFDREDIPEFSSRVSQSAIGAIIGLSFTLFMNFLVKTWSDVKNRKSSLRTALVIVDTTIQSLLLLKKDLLLPKYQETKEDNYGRDLAAILAMNQDQFSDFLTARPATFICTLNPKYSIDLDPKEFFYFLETESDDVRERLDAMLKYYCGVKINLNYLNDALEYQNFLLKECERAEADFDAIKGNKRIQYVSKYLANLKKIHDRTLSLSETILVFALELRNEILSFPGMLQPKHGFKQEFASLLPKDDRYKKVLDEDFYLRYSKRKKGWLLRNFRKHLKKISECL